VPRPLQTLAQRWLRAVYAAKCTPAQAHTLAAYACYLSAAGIIQVDQQTIAEMTGRPPRKVREHVTAAITMGLLTVDAPAAPGRPTRYRALLP
jgi:hypothetical protein